MDTWITAVCGFSFSDHFCIRQKQVPVLRALVGQMHPSEISQDWDSAKLGSRRH